MNDAGGLQGLQRAEQLQRAEEENTRRRGFKKNRFADESGRPVRFSLRTSDSRRIAYLLRDGSDLQKR